MIASSCHVHIHWEHFRHNLCQLMRKGKKLMPVIKADAYGHGVLPASDILTELGIDWAAISTLEEGRLVRDHGYEGNIVSLLSFTLSPEDVRLAHEKRIIPVVHDWTGLKAVQAALAAEDIEHFDIAIKVDTGMCRLGFSVDEMEEMGIVGPYQGSKPREILITKEQWEEMRSGKPAQMDFDEYVEEDSAVPEDF